MVKFIVYNYIPSIPDTLLDSDRTPRLHKCNCLNLNIKQRSHPHHPQTRSPKSQHQTVIAPHHPTPDRLSPQIKQRSPFITHKTDRLSPQIKQRSPSFNYLKNHLIKNPNFFLACEWYSSKHS
ncbi:MULTISPECIES: hypothetical protein [Pseudanabaena]|uniref:hypothetical protein n=1 Tax=Pseudanabaena TaxID=1152 RepID=UPI002479689D|nr:MULTISPECIES: hypothetical protein [Pseudanabaena]MEA5489016.1 hypothetical protein [Pseudanabaena sp. CCNP1317]WGS72928.1 hypothetical protein OA858_02575 [Pseudanabaena galeata CCNP1313]